MTTHAIPIARERPYGLYAICFGFFLVLLDTTALNVAAASMEREFGSTISGLQWVVNSYTIVFASLVLTAGAVGDRFGAKRLYQTGLVLFTSMSLLCGLAPSVGALIGFRMIQGLGAAAMLPASLALLRHAFPDGRARASAVAFWASIVSLGFAAGPALGGIMTYAFGWRSIFFINVPAGLAALTMIRRHVDETPSTNIRHIDWTGQAFASLSLCALTYSLIEAGRAGWTAPRIVIGFGLAVLLAIALGVAERHSTSPVLPRNLFASPPFSASIASGIVMGFGTYGTLFVVALRLQNVDHMSALAAGLMMVPFTVTPTLTTRAIDRFAGGMHFKPRLVTGHAIGVAGAAVMLASLWAAGHGVVELGLALLGIAVGYITPAMTTGVLAATAAESSGAASGILNAGRQVGAALGVALMGTLVQTLGDRGLVASFAIMILTYGGVGLFTARS
jgi:DHA2 family methylenomycin A resistance protein-like MFS transporter